MLLPSTKPCFCSGDQKCFQTNATKVEDTDLLSTDGQHQTIQWQELWTDKITLDKEEEVPLLTSDKLISISHFYKAGKLLLILVLTLLLCENVASLPMNVRGTGNDQVYLQDLFNHAIRLSYNISELNREMRKMFFISDFSSNKFLKFMLELNKDEENMPKMLESCHTPPINTPKTIQESRKLALEDFLIIILNLMGTWKEPLHYQVTKLSGMPGANETLLSTAKNIEARNKELLELTKWILNMVHPGIQHEDYAEWSDLKSLQAADEETGLFALFKLSFCLGIDTYIVDLNLKYLICVFVGGNTCSFSRFRYDPYDPFF